MKKVLLTAILFFLPFSAFAQMPFLDNFQKEADRMGIDRDTQEQIIQFSEGLKDDMVVDYTVTSLYPPVMDIIFASGKEIHATENALHLIDGTDREIDAEQVCPPMLALGAILTWSGFFIMSLPLLVAGVELLILTYIICS